MALEGGRLLSTRDLEALTGVPGQSWRRMRCDGVGPVFLKLGDGAKAKVVYRESDIEAWLSSRIRIPTGDGAAE